jgi:hypothetical protein
MAKGKVCLVLIETKKIRGEKVLAGTVLMEGALARAFSPTDLSKAVHLGQVRMEIKKTNGEKHDA